jgi:heterodisulfide reductase subunit A-like polyferredoxin
MENPERSHEGDPVLGLDRNVCLVCGECSLRCVYGALTWRSEGNGDLSRLHYRAKRCRRCGDCIAACPAKALGWVR